MTMEAAGLVEQRRDGVEHAKKVGYAHKIIKRKNRCKRRSVQRYAPKVPSVLQELFLSCRDVFKGPGTVPSPFDVQKLCRILDNMKPEDVGLSSKLLQFFSATDRTPIVTSTTIHKCKNFSLCLFFLPPTAVIPLHNHPEMTVFSKLLLGTMHIKSYDWVDPIDLNFSPPSGQSKLAKLVSDSDFTAPCDTSVLYPTTGGNIHEFTAITTCAVLDVLGPPYSKDDGRDCSHYKELSLSSSTLPNGETNSERKEDGDEILRWLEEIEMPENSQMDEIEYLGPQIVEY
ncbi:Plant cysteine oxidase 2-like [Melia azedarach]|uniref:Plant cysteine oxidase 2-like n=1 Tax=Melia azedarach TaxID=155640 RepID=A0ACC1YDL0_MELAZ|nr:Plant cysteine oxidase 2-like [Melia azedarach]